MGRRLKKKREEEQIDRKVFLYIQCYIGETGNQGRGCETSKIKSGRAGKEKGRGNQTNNQLGGESEIKRIVRGRNL